MVSCGAAASKQIMFATETPMNAAATHIIFSIVSSSFAAAVVKP